MDVDSQVEEFDSSSSESSDSSSDEEQRSGDEGQSEQSQEETAPEERPGQPSRSRKRKRDRRRHAAGLRKTLRTHYESVEDFNPEARSAQSAELERIRRLELQQSIVSPPTSTTVTTSHHHTHHTLTTSQDANRASSGSPKLVHVDLSQKTAPPKETIVIDSDSGSDGDEKGKPPVSKVEGQPSARVEGLHRKYDDPTVPRPDGRVVVNMGHGVGEPDVFLAPQVARIVKPHQIGGIRFLYDNIIESIARYSTSPGFGCILAHSMGLGKTLQVISFIDVFMRYTPAKHTLCVVPVNTLQNWVNEFDRWLPAQSANQIASLGQMIGFPLDDTQHRTFGLFLLSESCRSMEARVKVISEWQEVGGVMLIGYEMFRLLSLSVPSLAGNKMAVKRRRNFMPKQESGTINLDETEKEMDALIGIQRALCDPGPDLVVCDEGHRIKNDYSNISQALKRIRTRRRIVMTGYPLQNNLMEYWCMVDFVRPKYLGTKQEFADLFERPITNGQCADSTPNDVRLMRYRSHVLHSLLEGFVLRRGHEILKSTLPPKFEHVLFLRPSEVQGVLYNHNMLLIQQGGGVSTSNGPLKAFAVCTKIWNHPDIYHQEAMAQAKGSSLSSLLDDAGLSKSALSGLKVTGGESSCRLDWPHSQLPSYQPGCLEHSPKMAVLVELIDKSVHYGDKILVFSQSLSTLSYVEKVLTQRNVPVPDCGMGAGNGAMQYQNVTWTKSKNFCRIDGSTSSLERDKLINSFNSPANRECWVFLLSTKAGCLGINLIGANRVVVLDVSWNPCYDAQAVCRVYRYGQTKPCYIYRLVCDGTMERKIYDRQISKQGMSDRVVDHLQPERHLSTQDIISLITPLTPLPPSRDLSSFATEYLFDPVLMSLCYTRGQLLTKLPFKHESLLIDSADERMTEVEKYLALRGFQAEWRALKSGPSSIQEYRAMQARTTPLPSSKPTLLATPTPPQAPSPLSIGTSIPAPVISKSNEPVVVICLDSDEDDNTLVTPPQPLPITFDPTKLVQSTFAPLLSTLAQSHFTASQMSTQQSLIPIKASPPIPLPTTVSDQSVLNSFLNQPTTLAPSVTTAQLSQLAEGIVDTLKSQLLTTSLTRHQMDQTKMAAAEQQKKKECGLTVPNVPTEGQSTHGQQSLTQSTDDTRAMMSSVDHVTPPSEKTPHPPLSDETTPPNTTNKTNIHLNTNTNNAAEEKGGIFPQNKFTIVPTPTNPDSDDTASKSTYGEGWRNQSEKSRKAAKKERSTGPSSWQPPHPPPVPTTNYVPCSIPLLTPIAAHLLYMSTGVKLPSSPPEDVLKYPPIVSPAPSSPTSSQDDMDWYQTDEGGIEEITPPECALNRIEVSMGNKHGELSGESGSKPFELRTVLMEGSQNQEANQIEPISPPPVSEGQTANNPPPPSVTSPIYPMLCSPLPLLGQGSQDQSMERRDQSAAGQEQGQRATYKNGVSEQSLIAPSETLQSFVQSMDVYSHPLNMPSSIVTTCPPNMPNSIVTTRPPNMPSSIVTTRPLNMPSSIVTTRPPNMPSSIVTTRPQNMPGSIVTTRPPNMPSSIVTIHPMSMPSSIVTTHPPSMLGSIVTTHPPSMPSSIMTTHPLSIPSSIVTTYPPSMPSSVVTTHLMSMPSSIVTTRPPNMPSSIVTTRPQNMPSSIVTTRPPNMPSSILTTRPPNMPNSIVTTRPPNMLSSIVTTRPLSMPSSILTTRPPSMPNSIVTTRPPNMLSSVVTTRPLSMSSSIVTTRPLSMPSSIVTTRPPNMLSSVVTTRPLSMPSSIVTTCSMSMPSSIVTTHPLSMLTISGSSNSQNTAASFISSSESSFFNPTSLLTQTVQSSQHTSDKETKAVSWSAPSEQWSSPTLQQVTPISPMTTPSHTSSTTFTMGSCGNSRSSTFNPTIATPIMKQEPSSLTADMAKTSLFKPSHNTQISEPSISKYFVDSAKARHSSQKGTTQDRIKGQNSLKAQDLGNNVSTESPSKAKWIRSFSESEAPSAKGSVSAHLPSPSMYDPQPILCIDNWARSGHNMDTSTQDGADLSHHNATSEQPSTLNCSNTVRGVQSEVAKLPTLAGGLELKALVDKMRAQIAATEQISGKRSVTATKQVKRNRPLLNSALDKLSSASQVQSSQFNKVSFPNRGLTTPTMEPNLYGLDSDLTPNSIPSSAAKPAPVARPQVTLPLINPSSLNNQSPWKPVNGTSVYSNSNIPQQMPSNRPPGVTNLRTTEIQHTLSNSVSLDPKLSNLLKSFNSRSNGTVQSKRSTQIQSNVDPQIKNGLLPKNNSSTQRNHISSYFTTSHNGSGFTAVVNGIHSPMAITSPTHQAVTPPLSGSDRGRFNFDVSTQGGETCMLSSNHTQLSRTKKTAVVTPYCVVNNRTSSDIVTKFNSNDASMVGVTQTQLNAPLSRQKMATYSQGTVTSVCSTVNQQGGSAPPLDKRTSCALHVDSDKSVKDIIRQNLLQNAASHSGNMPQNGISSSQNVNQNLACRNRTQSDSSGTFLFSQRYTNNTPPTTPSQLTPPIITPPPPQSVTLKEAHQLKGSHFPTNGTSLPAHTHNNDQGGQSNRNLSILLNQISSAQYKRQKVRRFSMDSNQSIPRSNLAPNKLTTPSHHADIVFPGAGQRIIMSMQSPTMAEDTTTPLYQKPQSNLQLLPSVLNQVPGDFKSATLQTQQSITPAHIQQKGRPGIPMSQSPVLSSPPCQYKKESGQPGIALQISPQTIISPPPTQQSTSSLLSPPLQPTSLPHWVTMATSAAKQVTNQHQVLLNSSPATTLNVSQPPSNHSISPSHLSPGTSSATPSHSNGDVRRSSITSNGAWVSPRNVVFTTSPTNQLQSWSVITDTSVIHPQSQSSSVAVHGSVGNSALPVEFSKLQQEISRPQLGISRPQQGVIPSLSNHYLQGSVIERISPNGATQQISPLTVNGMSAVQRFSSSSVEHIPQMQSGVSLPQIHQSANQTGLPQAPCQSQPFVMTSPPGHLQLHQHESLESDQTADVALLTPTPTEHAQKQSATPTNSRMPPSYRATNVAQDLNYAVPSLYRQNNEPVARQLTSPTHHVQLPPFDHISQVQRSSAIGHSRVGVATRLCK